MRASAIQMAETIEALHREIAKRDAIIRNCERRFLAASGAAAVFACAWLVSILR